MNEFGLFGDVKGKKIRLYGNELERTSKYLLTYNYIPQNFDAILFGPSHSDVEMDTRELMGIKTYNLSLNGANISEVKLLVKNAIDRGHLKLIIVCLSDYLTKNHGKKTTAINPKELYSTLGSLFTIRYYYYKRYEALKYPQKDAFRDSWYGFRHNNYDVYKKYNSKERIDSTVESINNGKYKLNVDPIAIKELDETLRYARKKGIKIFGYYYVKHYTIFEAKNYQKEYAKFRKAIESTLREEDIVLDLNTPKFDKLRKDYATFSDGSHLSEKGAKEVLKALQEQIYKHKLDKL
jgi:hypothetical protein